MSVTFNFRLFCCSLLVSTQFLFSQIVLQGTVTDNGGELLGSGADAVAGALVTLTCQEDTALTYSAYSDDQGSYRIEIPVSHADDSDGGPPRRLRLLQNYPNPFNPSTVISYRLAQPAHVTVEIFNVLGRKVRTLVDGFQTELAGQVVWQARDDRGQGVSAGVYICSLRSNGKSVNKKMLLLDGHRGAGGTTVAGAFSTDRTAQLPAPAQGSGQYVLRAGCADFEIFEQQHVEITADTTCDIVLIRTLTDIDGNVSRAVKIGDQWWQAENLNVTRFQNGDGIPQVTGGTAWRASTAAARCAFDNDEDNTQIYGRLYNWHAVDDCRGLAPEGWHVPTAAETAELHAFLGSGGGGRLKEAGTDHWQGPNTGAGNESGFTALPGGRRGAAEAGFDSLGYAARFWTAAAADGDSALTWSVRYDAADLFSGGGPVRAGLSVRLIEDTGTPPELSGVRIDSVGGQISAGDSLLLTCRALYADGSTKSASAAAVWSLAPGIAGTLTDDGVFIADETVTGTERVIASWQGHNDTLTIAVVERTTGTLTDVDGNVYRTVKIGDQWWMAENLRVRHYIDGTPIPAVPGNGEWGALTSAGYCVYDNNEENAAIYGCLYNWWAVDGSRVIAPEGWRVPTDGDWNELVSFLGGAETAGGTLKEAGTSHWGAPNTGATNESGFTALPGGYRVFHGSYYNLLGSYGTYWSVTENGADAAWFRGLDRENSAVGRSSGDKKSGFSVRLVME